MDPNQRRSRMDIAHDKSYGSFNPAIVANVAFKTEDAKLPPATGKISFSHLANCGFGTHLSIIDRAGPEVFSGATRANIRLCRSVIPSPKSRKCRFNSFAR